MRVTIKHDENGAFIDINDLAEMYDITKIAYYTVDNNENGTITLKVYNKQKRLLKPKTEKKTRGRKPKDI